MPPRARLLAAFLLASIVVHTVAVALLPPRERPETRVEVLDVTLVRPEPPPAIEPPRMQSPPAPPKAKPVPREAPAKRAAPPPSVARPPEPKPELLATPAQPTQQPAFSVPPPEPAPRVAVPEQTGEASPRQEAARTGAGTGAKGDAAPGEKQGPVTPPGFNAAYLRNPAPRYPVSARRNGEQGTVTLRVLVTRDGAASSVTVEKTSGSRALDDAAVDAVRSWRFAPARQGSQPVEAWVLVPIVFRLDAAS